MTPPFSVQVTAHFEREFRKLAKRHGELADVFARAISILKRDPYNVSRTHAIKKLEGVDVGEGQYRLRIGRWRFRYDIAEKVVYLKACSLRREDTYR